MVFHFFRVLAVLLSDLDHLLPILEGPLWSCDSFVSGPFLTCEGPLRPTDGPPADRGRLEGPLPNRTALCRPERVIRSVFYQTGGPSVGLGGPSVGIGRSEGPSICLGGPSVGLRVLCRTEGPLSGWGPSVGLRALCPLKGPSVGWKGHLSVWEGRPVCPLPILTALCRP